MPHGYRLAFGSGGNRSWPDAIGRQGSWDVRDGVELLPPVGARWLCTKLLRQPYRGRRSIDPMSDQNENRANDTEHQERVLEAAIQTAEWSAELNRRLQ